MSSDKYSIDHNILAKKVYNHFKLNIKQWIDGDLTDISKWMGLACAIIEFVERDEGAKGQDSGPVIEKKTAEVQEE